MSIAPTELLKQAKSFDLADELNVRNAIGRGYYVAYHMAKEFHDGLGSQGALPTQGGVHEILIHQLTNPTLLHTDPLAVKSRQVGYLLKLIRPKRIKADYYLCDELSKSEAVQVMCEAEKLATFCNK